MQLGWDSEPLYEVPIHPNYLPIGMTAISWLWRSSAGFVLAADGKAKATAETDEEVGNEPPDKYSEQKIFPAKFRGRDIAFGLTGQIFNQEKTFDFIAETNAVLTSLANSQNLYEYIDRYAEKAKAAFEKAKQDGRIKKYGGVHHDCDPPGQSIVARIFFAGYFRKEQPSFAIVTLIREEQVLIDPHRKYESPPQNDYLAGSKIAALIIGKESHWVKDYAKPVARNGSFEELKLLAKGFIDACKDPRALEIDADCENIGGKVHVARLTMQNGFEWIDAP